MKYQELQEKAKSLGLRYTGVSREELEASIQKAEAKQSTPHKSEHTEKVEAENKPSEPEESNEVKKASDVTGEPSDVVYVPKDSTKEDEKRPEINIEKSTEGQAIVKDEDGKEIKHPEKLNVHVSNPPVRESEDTVQEKGTVVVSTPDGQRRTYSREVHGDKFEELAHEYAAKRNGTVSTE